MKVHIKEYLSFTGDPVTISRPKLAKYVEFTDPDGQVIGRYDSRR